MKKEGHATFGSYVATFGTILIAVGIAWLLAQNWHQIPAAAKIIILIVATVISFILGNYLRSQNYTGVGKALLSLGSLIYTLSIFLIAQIFSTETTMQGIAWLWLLAFIGVFIAAYLFDSSSSLAIALTELIVWLVVQYMAFFENSFQAEFSLGILALYFLAAGVLLYGVSLLHQAKQLSFAKFYQGWTAFYLLAFTYLLSFQMLLPLMWPRGIMLASRPMLFLFFLVLVALIFLIIGMKRMQETREISSKEITAVMTIVLILALLIGSTKFVAGQNYWSFFGAANSIPLTLWGLWILVNVVFIGIILAVLGYGILHKMPHVINLGMAFFTLDIITRYIGFIMDFHGYTSLSVLFITGGILLIVGGWGIEKWRRSLIAKAR